jgi:hypothetical protein
MRKSKIVIQKLKSDGGTKNLYRVIKIINSKRLSLMDTDYEEDEIKSIIERFPTSYDYQIIQRQGV